MLLSLDTVVAAETTSDFLLLQQVMNASMKQFLVQNSYAEHRVHELSADFVNRLNNEIDGVLDKFRFLGNEHQDSVMLVAHLVARVAYYTMRNVLRSENEVINANLDKSFAAIQFLVANRLGSAIHMLTCENCRKSLEEGKQPGHRQ